MKLNHDAIRTGIVVGCVGLLVAHLSRKSYNILKDPETYVENQFRKGELLEKGEAYSDYGAELKEVAAVETSVSRMANQEVL